MKYVYLTLNWVFGALFLLTGVFSLVESPLAGLCLIAAAALLLPPVRNFVYSKTNKEFPVKARVISIFILFMAFGFFVGQAQDRKEQELAAQQAQDYFNANREQIVSTVKKALSEKDYQSVISQSNKYLVAGDKELEQMNAQAKNELASIEKAKKTEKLLTELEGVPAQEYEKNRSLYQQLLSLHPDNELYKTKVAFYTGKVEEEKQKKIAAEARKKKIETQFSPWDGSHRNLERVIKDSMNDPDSYDHVETVYWDRGDHLVVRTTFRGKNAFGAVVKNSVKAKVSLDGQVLQLLDQY
jgi:uncharacterized protein (UPF0297 family)